MCDGTNGASSDPAQSGGASFYIMSLVTCLGKAEDIAQGACYAIWVVATHYWRLGPVDISVGLRA
jgi:hypothetical protein